jgi:hypothetical protein
MLLLDWRFWAAVALAAAGGYFTGRHDGTTIERATWQEAAAQANADARRLEQRRQDRADEAARLAAAREDRIRADAARARSESDGLRDTLDAVERASAQSFDAARKSVAALRDVFEQCSREYQSLAETADRHASDSLKLQQAWPQP